MSKSVREKNDRLKKFKAESEALLLDLEKQVRSCYRIFQDSPYTWTENVLFSDVYIKEMWDVPMIHTYNVGPIPVGISEYACNIMASIGGQDFRCVIFPITINSSNDENETESFPKGMTAKINGDMFKDGVVLIHREGVKITDKDNIILCYGGKSFEDTIRSHFCDNGDIEYITDEKTVLVLCTEEKFSTIFNHFVYMRVFDDSRGQDCSSVVTCFKKKCAQRVRAKCVDGDDVSYWYPTWYDVVCYYRSAPKSDEDSNTWGYNTPNVFSNILGKYWFKYQKYMPNSKHFERKDEKALYVRVMEFLTILDDAPDAIAVDNFMFFEYRTRLLSCIFGIDNIIKLGILRDMERRGWLKKGQRTVSREFLECLLLAFRGLQKNSKQADIPLSEFNEMCAKRGVTPFGLDLRKNFDVLFLLIGYMASDKSRLVLWGDMLILLWAIPELYKIIKENQSRILQKKLCEINLEEINVRMNRIIKNQDMFIHDFEKKFDKWFYFDEPAIELDKSGRLSGGMFSDYPAELIGKKDSVEEKPLRNKGQNTNLLYHTLRYIQWVFPEEKCLQTALLNRRGGGTDINFDWTYWCDWILMRWEMKQ